MTIKLKNLIQENFDGVVKGIDGVIKKQFGWLTNRGEFYGVPYSGHLKALKELPLPSDMSNLYDELQQDIDAAEESCQELVDAGEHGEWHHYEMTVDRSIDRFVEELYKHGWIRIGKSYHDNVFEFEGKPESLKSKMDYINKFKNCLDPKIGIRLEPR